MPSHNCIIMKNNVQFSRCIWISQETQWNPNSRWCFSQSLLSKKWWAKMDSLSCGKATAVTICHRHIVKSRLSSHFVLLPNSSVPSDRFFYFAFLKWWAKMDSNHRPHDYQSCALASWAIGPYLVEIKSTISVLKFRFQNSPVALFLLSESNPLRWALLRYHVLWWRVPGSNRWPPACKAGALPAELTPHF